MAVKSRFAQATHKYGIEILCTIDKAFKLDEKNKDMFWCDVVNKKIENLKVVFDILLEGKSSPPTYRKASSNIIFDIRITLERKARWVKDGHLVNMRRSSLQESARIALAYASLNDLSICGCDI